MPRSRGQDDDVWTFTAEHADVFCTQLDVDADVAEVPALPGIADGQDGGADISGPGPAAAFAAAAF